MGRKRRAEGQRPRRKGWRLAVVLVLLLAVAGVWFFSQNGRTQIQSQTVDLALRDIGELATQEGYYTNVNVITNPNRTIVGISIPFTSSKALCTYSGTIKAGLDFGGIQVTTDAARKEMVLTMPAVRVLSNEVVQELLFRHITVLVCYYLLSLKFHHTMIPIFPYYFLRMLEP